MYLLSVLLHIIRNKCTLTNLFFKCLNFLFFLKSLIPIVKYEQHTQIILIKVQISLSLRSVLAFEANP